MSAETINAALELHDSTLSAVERADKTLLLHLDPAYVHKSPGVPGKDAGEGWLCVVQIILRDAVDSVSIDSAECISDGALVCNGQRLDNLIPIPFSFAGKTHLSLVLTEGGKTLEIGANGVDVSLTNAGRFLEPFE